MVGITCAAKARELGVSRMAVWKRRYTLGVYDPSGRQWLYMPASGRRPSKPPCCLCGNLRTTASAAGLNTCARCEPEFNRRIVLPAVGGNHRLSHRKQILEMWLRFRRASDGIYCRDGVNKTFHDRTSASILRGVFSRALIRTTANVGNGAQSHDDVISGTSGRPAAVSAP
jgi:hypothetical protein